jgi:aminoglycoside 3-N-acetyltransferase I
VFETDAEPLSDQYLTRILSRDDFWALAASIDGGIVGGLTAHTLPLTQREISEVFIYDLAVVPACQRQGVGRALVTTLRSLAAAAGVPVVFVAADNEDTHALDFYRAVGGTPAPVTVFTFSAARA